MALSSDEVAFTQDGDEWQGVSRAAMREMSGLEGVEHTSRVTRVHSNKDDIDWQKGTKKPEMHQVAQIILITSIPIFRRNDLSVAPHTCEIY